MRLLVCGARILTASDSAWVWPAILALRPHTIIHGGARGADMLAAEWAEANGIKAITYPADWARDGRAAGPIRNERMLRGGLPDRGLAFGALWKEDWSLRGKAAPAWRHTGTGGMVSLMLRAGLPVRWVAAHDAVAMDLVEMPEAGR